jgi:hypothetical protein
MNVGRDEMTCLAFGRRKFDEKRVEYVLRFQSGLQHRIEHYSCE